MESEPNQDKFESPHDQVLYQMSLDGWCNESSGSTTSVVGWFARISIEPDELAEVVDAFTDVLYDLEYGVPDDLLGHWLVSDTGSVRVVSFDSEREVKQAYDDLETVYTNIGKAE